MVFFLYDDPLRECRATILSCSRVSTIVKRGIIAGAVRLSDDLDDVLVHDEEFDELLGFFQFRKEVRAEGMFEP
jgi:hypothetical protein